MFSAHAWLWLQTVEFTLFNLLTWGLYLVLGPVLARDYLGGARAWGAILACYGGGAVIEEVIDSLNFAGFCFRRWPGQPHAAQQGRRLPECLVRAGRLGHGVESDDRDR